MAETKHPVDLHLLLHQKHINALMRSILVAWMWEVCKSFKLNAETFFTSVALLDRFLLQSTPVLRSKLQLIGMVSLLVASKIEEKFSPEIRDFVYISDNAYTSDDIRTCEQMFVNAINWRLKTPPMKICSSFEEYAAVVMAIDGCLNLAQASNSRRRRANIRRISKRLKTASTPWTMETRSQGRRHDPLHVLENGKLRIGEMRAFYMKLGRLRFEDLEASPPQTEHVSN